MTLPPPVSMAHHLFVSPALFARLLKLMPEDGYADHVALLGADITAAIVRNPIRTPVLVDRKVPWAAYLDGPICLTFKP